MSNRTINQNLLHVQIMTTTNEQKLPDLMFYLPDGCGNNHLCILLRKSTLLLLKDADMFQWSQYSGINSLLKP
ncbi:hypothetical protein [Nitrosomonas sp. Nm33]|uniref:hypothetical protein n=1 Tax=Nitrosomonas sp. Nm33 TaxID=133724 RepID=UPI00115FE5EC|nr:hypothetical protein [Nitrosomonas sp. Nm33]